MNGFDSADVTTRQNSQLRGMPLRVIPAVLDRLGEAGVSTLQTGLDNSRESADSRRASPMATSAPCPSRYRMSQAMTI